MPKDLSNVAIGLEHCVVGTVIIAVEDPEAPGRYYVLGHPQYKIRDRSVRACKGLFIGWPCLIGKVLLKEADPRLPGNYLVDIEASVLLYNA
jgi:hypothetical protein